MNRTFKLKLHFTLLVKLAEINCRVNYWMTILAVAQLSSLDSGVNMNQSSFIHL